MHVTIRPAREQDIAALTSLWEEMMRFHAQHDERLQWDPTQTASWQEYMRHLINQEDARVLVAEADHQIVGYIVGYVRANPPVRLPPHYGYVSDICVAATARRQGIGRALFEHLTAWFREQGLDHVELLVAARNPVSQAFWRSLGCEDYMERLWYTL